MVQERTRIIPKRGAQERISRNQQVQLPIEVRRCLHEKVPFVESFTQKLIALDGVALQEHHLFKVSHTSVRHLGRSTRRPTCKIKFINDRAFQSPTCRVKSNSSSVGTTSHDEYIELFIFLLETFELLVTVSEFIFVFDFIRFSYFRCIPNEFRCSQFCQSVWL